MQITIEGKHASIAHDHDAHFTYVVSFSERPMLVIGHDDYRQLLIAFVKELVKAASGWWLFVIDRHQKPLQSGWEPYINTVKQVNRTQWEVQIIYPYTD